MLADLALAVHTLAIPLEHDNAGAFGDNSGGLVMLAPFFIFMVQFMVNGRVASHTVSVIGVAVREEETTDSSPLAKNREKEAEQRRSKSHEAAPTPEGAL